MIYIGSDHGGFFLKEKIKEFLTQKGLEVKDCGNDAYDAEDDYPEFAFKVAESVAGSKNKKTWAKEDKGILLCRSSLGMVIAANKVKGIRAGSVHDIEGARKAREHNDLNVIALSGDNMSVMHACNIIETWLTTEFSSEARHQRRVERIKVYENA